MSDPVFLDVEDVLFIHGEQLAVYGGSAGIRDAGLLESAVAMPRATAGGELAHEDLFAMAAAYAFHIAQNQPFVDGLLRHGCISAMGLLTFGLNVTLDGCCDRGRTRRGPRRQLALLDVGQQQVALEEGSSAPCGQATGDSLAAGTGIRSDRWRFRPSRHGEARRAPSQEASRPAASALRRAP